MAHRTQRAPCRWTRRSKTTSKILVLNHPRTGTTLRRDLLRLTKCCRRDVYASLMRVCGGSVREEYCMFVVAVFFEAKRDAVSGMRAALISHAAESRAN